MICGLSEQGDLLPARALCLVGVLGDWFLG